MMSKDAVENEDTSYNSAQPLPSLNLENLPSDVMNLVDGRETDLLIHQLFGGGANGRSMDSADNSMGSFMSQGSHGSQGSQGSYGSQGSQGSQVSQSSQPSPFASILPSIPQPAEVPSPAMEVTLINSIIRFRYDSELNNRRTGKEELLKIKFTGVEGNVTVLLHTVDTNNKKAHPYWLIGDKCADGMFVATVPINKTNNYECTCKATLKIPKRNEYQTSLQARQTKAVALNINNDDMRNEDYWTANKNMKECRDFRLYVEARYEVSGNIYHMHCITPPLSNAKEGKCFMIHRIMPYVSPASGIQNTKDYIMIVLTADSYIPKAVEVDFVDEDAAWSAKTTKVNIIKNCIECAVPPYKDQDLKGAREVIIRIHDKQKSMVAAYNFMYKGNEESQMVKKRKMAVNYCAPADLLQESGIDMSSFTEQRRPALKATRAKKQGSGGFLKKATQTSTATTEQPISHFGVNASVQLPQLIVKEEPTDTYEGACSYQGSRNALFSAGEEVTNLLTRGHDPNLQSMSINGAEQTSFNSVSLLLPSGSDGSDREVSMETGFNRSAPATNAANVGVGGYSQSDQMRIQKIMQDLVAGSPGHQTSQPEVSELQKVDDSSLVTFLQSLQQNVMRNADGQENSQLTFPDATTQIQNQPMYSISSSLGGRDTTPAHTGFPVRQTFNPVLQRNAQDIQNMLSTQYPGYEGIDATEAGDLETDGGSQAPNNVRLVWQSNEGSREELDDLSDTEVDGDLEFHNMLSSHTDGVKPEVIRAEAILVKRTHPTPAVEMTGKCKSKNTESNAERWDACDTCIKNISSANTDNKGEQIAPVHADTSDLVTDFGSGDLSRDTVGTEQTDPGVCARVGEEEEEEAGPDTGSPRSTGDVEGEKLTIPHSEDTNKPTPQDDVSDGLKRLAL